MRAVGGREMDSTWSVILGQGQVCRLLTPRILAWEVILTIGALGVDGKDHSIHELDLTAKTQTMIFHTVSTHATRARIVYICN